MPRTENQIKSIIKQYDSQNLVFYDSPERILKTLKVIQSCRGNAKIALGRELTKLFEEVIIKDISDAIEYFSNGVKGEIVCMIYPETSKNTIDISAKVKILKDNGFKGKEISIILSSLFSYNKNEVYKETLK